VAPAEQARRASSCREGFSAERVARVSCPYLQVEGASWHVGVGRGDILKRLVKAGDKFRGHVGKVTRWQGEVYA